MSSPRVLIYLLRRDLRVADNPILNEVSKVTQQSQRPFTHFLPVYVFAAQQIEGLIGIGSGLEIRVGMAGQVIKELIDAFKQANTEIAGVWMTDEEGMEEKREERDVREVAENAQTEFRLWIDEKYYVDDRDLPFQSSQQLPDVFTTYRKQVEPLREAPRRSLPAPKSLLPLPKTIPPQPAPFSIPETREEIFSCLTKPLEPGLGLFNPPKWPPNAQSAHPFHGGESTGHGRIKHLITSGNMTTYKDTRNGMLGLDFSTKLSAWLALGCITARQVHEYLVAFEEGKSDLGKGVHGYGKGENKGTAAVRFELLWRDYFRLATRKFGPRLFRIEGFKNDASYPWKYAQKDKGVQHTVSRFLEGTTGNGFIDASIRLRPACFTPVEAEAEVVEEEGAKEEEEEEEEEEEDQGLGTAIMAEGDTIDLEDKADKG
ncbi:MAG: hypothetical protein LQ344_003257 [Seirophora lacunosa]|nr:MAG: hypothetical protein LQ344_003257 [Seirophora lacunosa]